MSFRKDILNGADLRAALLIGGHWGGAILMGADLTGATWTWTAGKKKCAEGSIGVCK